MKSYFPKKILPFFYPLPLIVALGCILTIFISSQMVIAQDASRVYTAVDQMPELKNSLSALYEKIEYPQKAQKHGISGWVYLRFVVNKNGKVINPKVVKGIGGGCDEAAQKAIKEVDFIPGKKDGKSVRVRTNLPIIFRIENQLFHYDNTR